MRPSTGVYESRTLSSIYYYYELLVVPWDIFEKINICELHRKITILSNSIFLCTVVLVKYVISVC